MQKTHNKFSKRFYLIPVNRKMAAMLVCSAILSISAFAFGKKNAADWKLTASVHNVDFYYSISVCNGKQVVFLKFVNKNSNAVSVSFREALQSSKGTEEMSFTGKKKFTIQPGETLAQSCEQNTCKECIILPEVAIPTHKVDVQQFQFKEIEVSIR